MYASISDTTFGLWTAIDVWWGLHNNMSHIFRIFSNAKKVRWQLEYIKMKRSKNHSKCIYKYAMPIRKQPISKLGWKYAVLSQHDMAARMLPIQLFFYCFVVIQRYRHQYQKTSICLSNAPVNDSQQSCCISNNFEMTIKIVRPLQLARINRPYRLGKTDLYIFMRTTLSRQTFVYSYFIAYAVNSSRNSNK